MLVNKKTLQTWEQLRTKKRQMNPFLLSLGLNNMRGISDLRVSFDYPVSVLAGPTGCGKSTVLLACACAYLPPQKPVLNMYTPANFFPILHSKKEPQLADNLGKPTLEYQYRNGTQNLTMLWQKKGTLWSKNFYGRQGVSQPQQDIYLRNLPNLNKPTEVRNILQVGRREFTVRELDSQELALAQSLLPYSYDSVKVLKENGKELLIASRGGSHYSEFQMATGERALLYLSKDLARLRSALVLIDELETGLHPALQEQLTLELQLLASSNDLQIIVSSHSQVVLGCVPREARIVLDYDDAGSVVLK